MFTGIVQAVGRIAATAPQGDGERVTIAAASGFFDDTSIGDSIAVKGCCLTVVQRDPSASAAAFDVSAETLRCTSGFVRDARVNLEKALRLMDRLGGHLVTGHIDGTGTVVELVPVAPDAAGQVSYRLMIEAPRELARYIASKGSIAVDGVSLTVNRVEGDCFDVNLIPHTLAVTTLRDLVTGARVNLEVDLMARYAERLRTAV